MPRLPELAYLYQLSAYEKDQLTIAGFAAELAGGDPEEAWIQALDLMRAECVS